jgi:hypothetical protein
MFHLGEAKKLRCNEWFNYTGPRQRCQESLYRLAESVDEVEDQAEENAQDDAGGKGKEKGEMIPLDDKVAREFAEEGKLRTGEQRYPHGDQYEAEHDEHLSDLMH